MTRATYAVMKGFGMKYNFKVGDAVETYFGLKGKVFYVNSKGEPFIRYENKTIERVTTEELDVAGLWRFLCIGRYRFEFKGGSYG